MRLLATGRGVRRGYDPKWLNDLTDFTITELTATEIEVTAPALRGIDNDLFRQQDFWLIEPDLDHTALDILSLAVDDICSEGSSGERFDESVLQAIASFKRFVKQPIIKLTIHQLEEKCRLIELDFEVINRAHQRLQNFAAAQAHLVSGILDRIEHKYKKFRLLVGDQQTLLGSMNSKQLDVESLRPLWGKRTTVSGIVYFKADGQPRIIEANRICKASNTDVLFEKLPTDETGDWEELIKAAKFNPMTLWGNWPGDETFEELMQMLNEMNNPKSSTKPSEKSKV